MAWNVDEFESGLTPEQLAEDRERNHRQAQSLLAYVAAMTWFQSKVEMAYQHAGQDMPESNAEGARNDSQPLDGAPIPPIA